MSVVIISVLGIAGSIALLVLTAAAVQPLVHLVIAAVMSVLIAVKCLSEQRRVATNPTLVASTAYHYIGLAWAWAGLTVFVTYNFILQWREWSHYFIACILMAGLCLFLSSTLRKDADGNSGDATMIKLSRTLSIVLLVAMTAVALGLLVHDGRMWHVGGKLAALTGAATQKAGSQEWAANNVFFAGAISVAVLAWTAYSALSKKGR